MTRIKPALRPLGMLLAATTLAGARPPAALAVDVINSDAAAREIVVNDDDGGSKVVKLAAHQKITGICQSCVVVLGNESVEASNTDIVQIAFGNISVRSK